MNPSTTSRNTSAGYRSVGNRSVSNRAARNEVAPTPTLSSAAGARSSGDGDAAGGADDGTSSISGDAEVPPEPDGECDRIEIELTIDPAVDAALDAEWLIRHVRRAIDHLPEQPAAAALAHVAVLVVDDQRMTSLHREHCDHDSTTDVLTFSLSEPGEPIEVEIAVCADEAARRAAGLGHPIERELLLYVLHGLLHCCGFDDHDDADFARMHETEDAILDAIGVGRTFQKRGGRER